MSKKESKFKPHPIKLLSIDVVELHIKLKVPPQPDQEANVRNAVIEVGHSDYNETEKLIQIGLRLEMGAEENKDNAPFFMRIELIGTFEVDESKFPPEHIYDWAEKNAPFILYPYLREHAYALTVRSGLKPVLLPLVEVPTPRLRKKKAKKERDPKTEKKK